MRPYENKSERGSGGEAHEGDNDQNEGENHPNSEQEEEAYRIRIAEE